MDDPGTASLHLGEVPRMRETPLCNRTPMLDGDGTMSDAKTWRKQNCALGNSMVDIDLGWDEKAMDHAVAHHTYEYLSPNENALYVSGFTCGARWQRDQLRSDDAVERVIRQAKAEAWDEGRESVGEQMLQPRDEYGMFPPVANPYRGGQ